jgi:hypothetical protein
MFTRRAKSIRKIDDSQNQRPDMWSSIVYSCTTVLKHRYLHLWHKELEFKHGGR